MSQRGTQTGNIGTCFIRTLRAKVVLRCPGGTVINRTALPLVLASTSQTEPCYQNHRRKNCQPNRCEQSNCCTPILKKPDKKISAHSILASSQTYDEFPLIGATTGESVPGATLVVLVGAPIWSEVDVKVVISRS